MNTIEKPRLSGLDIVRSCAIFFVIAGHFFSLHTHLFQSSINNFNLFVQTVFVTLFYSGVPLFLILTGFLNSKKELSRRYYLGIKRVIASYLIFSVLTIAFRIVVNHESLSVMEWSRKVLNFSAIPYGWYIELYIGLFLLIPFLNIIYNHLQSRKAKKWLILTFLILTAFPEFFNKGGFNFFPSYYTGIFAVTYYFIGAYIKEFTPSFNKIYLSCLLFIICLIDPLINYFILNDGYNLILCVGNTNASLYVVIIAVLFFLLVYNLRFNSKLITSISKYSLDMYLCCYILDKTIYPFFISSYYKNQSQFFEYFPIIVPLVFISSFVVAFIYNKIKEVLFR